MADSILDLRLRRDNVGGPVQDADAASIDAIVMALLAAPARGLVLLIHGYNNDLDDGRTAYEGFFTMQRGLAGLPENRPLAPDRVFARVFWPGDAGWGLFSFLFYMGSIGQAVLTADRLADALQRIAARLPARLEVDIVAHSMGCRIGFELLKRLAGNSSLEVRRITTMAAAVPLFMLEDPAEQHGLRRGYDRMMDPQRDKALSLHSRADPVLSLAFPIGQTVAGEGAFPTALGHDYWASSNPMAGLSQEEVLGARHSDYWGWEDGDEKQRIGRDANSRVQVFMDFDHAPGIVPPTYVPETRARPESRNVGENVTGSLASYWKNY